MTFVYRATQEERKRKKEQDELERKQAKLEKMAELERLKNPSRPNLVITKKDGPAVRQQNILMQSRTCTGPYSLRLPVYSTVVT